MLRVHGSGRDVATIVYITACSGDVQFGTHWVHAGQASVAMEP